MTSFPAMIIGIASDWIGAAFSYPSRSMAFSKRGRKAKLREKFRSHSDIFWRTSIGRYSNASVYRRMFYTHWHASATNMQFREIRGAFGSRIGRGITFDVQCWTTRHASALTDCARTHASFPETLLLRPAEKNCPEPDNFSLSNSLFADQEFRESSFASAVDGEGFLQERHFSV